MSFKPGDKVVCVNNDKLFELGYLELNGIFTTSQPATTTTFYLSENPGYAYTTDRFKLLEPSLEGLVKTANEGLKAIYEIFKHPDRDQVEENCYYETDFMPLLTSIVVMDSKGPQKQLRIRPKKKEFVPYVTEEGWEVRVDGDRVDIGCQSFNLDQLIENLDLVINHNAENLYLDGFATDRSYRYYLTFGGIKTSGGNLLSWESAKELLSKLKEYTNATS